MDRGGLRAGGSASADVSLVEAAWGAPAAFYQFRISPAGTYAIPFASPDFVARFGLEPGEPEETAARFLARIHPDDLTLINDAIARSAGTLETFECTFRARLASGDEAWVEARSNPRPMPDGGIAWDGVVTDVTARKRAEAALRESESRYRRLFDANPQPMWFFDTETLAFLEVNDAAVAHYGFRRDEFLAMTIADIRPPEDMPRLRDAVGRVGEGAIDEAGVWRHRKKDGSIILVEITSHALEYGGRSAELVLAHDITVRRNAEAAVSRLNTELEDALEWQRQIFEGSRDAVFLSDATGRFVAVNQAAEELTGYSRAELLAMSIPDLHDETDLGPYYEFHRRILGGERILSEAPIRRKDGQKVAVEFNNTLVEIRRTRLVHTAGRDVTERRRAEEASARFLAGSPAVIYALCHGPEGFRVSWFSENIQALTGYTSAEVRAADPGHWWKQKVHPDDLPRVLAANDEVLREGHATVEFRFCHKDGSWFWVHDEKRVLVGREDRPGEVVGSWVDVTSRVRLEAQLRQAQKMEAIGQLAGGVAHDFNNLLTVITGNTELLLSDSPAEDPKRGPLTDIRAAGERAASLTRQLLAFSRKQILEPKLVDLHGVIDGIEKMLRRLIGEDVDLVTNLAADPSWVKVDPGQIEQVVMNLAVNARDAMPRGGRLTIRTWNVDPSLSVDLDESPGSASTSRLALSISDTGLGISPEVKAHLFEPFFTTKAVGKGTGLGLATVYGIVKQSGGHVTVTSEPGKGATFTIVLPSQPAPGRANGSGASLRAVPRGSETVLVVEDEDAVRRIVRIALESTGYRVIEARSGPEALEAAQNHAAEIDLVVTDVVMPEMSGRELIESLRPSHEGLRVLYMSGYTDDAVVRHGVVEAGVAFLQKPFSPLSLARKVREVLDARS